MILLHEAPESTYYGTPTAIVNAGADSDVSTQGVAAGAESTYYGAPTASINYHISTSGDVTTQTSATSTTSATISQTSVASTRSRKSNAGPIAGAVVGGIIVLGLTGGLVRLLVRGAQVRSLIAYYLPGQIGEAYNCPTAVAPTSLIFLRPPPHMEFVQGFPGIPSNSERPLASVQGVVELRLGTSPVKAQWVKIELRKLETLPEGGQANTYIDLVGDSPITLWRAKNEWDEIRSQDLSFQIQLPESIPPSLALESSVGIRYELVASMLTKKKGILRWEAMRTVTASSEIVIVKHELHSAWPMYARPESRGTMLDGHMLTANRTHSAYGPGDRIAVQTLVKNDTQQVDQVRYYEFALRERVMYKPGGTQNETRKMMTHSQTSSRAIVEQRIPITMISPIHPGMEAKAELSLQVPFNQTTTTVSFAHRIEVQFVIRVGAVLTTGLQLFLDLPISISNWTRAQSIDFVNRIGPAGTLSTPGGVPGSAPSGFEQHPIATPAQGNPQLQMGFWPLNDAANDDDANHDAANHFNSRPVRTKGPPNRTAPSPSRNLFGDWAAPIFSGRFVDGWAVEAAERLSVTETMSSPQQPHSVYGNGFSAIPGGSIHPSNSMASGAVSSGFARQLLSVHSNPTLDAKNSRIWASENPTRSDPKAPSQEILTGNVLDQSALASHPSAAEEKQRLSYKPTMELANHTQFDVHRNEAPPVPYESLYPSEPSEPSAPAIDSMHSPNVTQSQSPEQGQDVEVYNLSSASSIPPSHEGRFATAEEEKELLGQIYEAQEVSAWPPGGTTVNGAPLDSPSYRPLDGSCTPAAQPRRTLPSLLATADPQSITATQGKPMLKESHTTEDVAQSGSGPRPLTLSPRNPLSLPSCPPSSVDMHQSPQQPNFSPKDGEMPLTPSSSSVAKSSTAGENNDQPGAKCAAEEVGEESANGSPSS
ncbi:hypothetical protein FS837_001997 [Tulasnella sp. UAMH 9824]|nr:hypothetical protein FS837_001997 [Tulasnella sp. UAMH 9824]